MSKRRTPKLWADHELLAALAATPERAQAILDQQKPENRHRIKQLRRRHHDR